MAPLTDDQWERLARDYAEHLSSHAPDWTDERDADPGVTLMQVFAFLAESLLDRSTSLPTRGRAHLRNALQRLDRVHALAGSAPAAPTRVRYFDGQLLTSADFETEQSYVRTRHRRHNLLLHGAGIVNGLDVTVDPSHAEVEPLVRVARGVAIGPDGEELLVHETLTTVLSGDSSPCYVTLHVVDRDLGTDTTGQASRVEEVVEVAVLAAVPDEHLAVARVERVAGAWRVDERFKPLMSARS